MLATPWPRKSPEASGYVPSGLGTELLIAAPWTSPTKASDSAGTASAPTMPKGGSSGQEARWVPR